MLMNSWGTSRAGGWCAHLDKADTALIFACPKLYVDKLMTDLEEGVTYRPTALTQGCRKVI